jgi:hypothetical protein
MGIENKPSDTQIYSSVRTQLKEEFEKRGYIATETESKIQQAIQFMASARESPSKEPVEGLKETGIFLKAYADQILEIAEQTGNLDYAVSSIRAYESLGVKPKGEILKKIQKVIENASKKRWVPSPRGILYEESFKNNPSNGNKREGQRNLIEEGRAYRETVTKSLREYLGESSSKTSGLERAIAVGIVSLAGLFLISSKITGNTIANLSTKTSSLLGAGLFVIVLIAGLIWIKNKKNS